MPSPARPHLRSPLCIHTGPERMRPVTPVGNEAVHHPRAERLFNARRRE
uniref:Predicted protein n=1 Tax=Hordeum vulgare subsp. vulgare TaxID=112509 RepID=F2CTF3_HORVV|nr:predicted protein [Hordeum vulgare subsp. vulgare]